MTTTVDRVVAAEAFGEPLLFGPLLELAQNVLRGRGDQGLLAGIEESDRLRFASALWLEGADGASMEFWVHNLCNILYDHGIDPCQIEIDGDSMCPCGYRLSRHADRCGMGLEGKSRASHLFVDGRNLDARIRAFRLDAIAQQPVLLDLVIEAAYGARGPASRRAHAWQVLEDIDHRRPLIAALARFFRVGPAAIRAFRHWRPASTPYWLAYPSARRVALMLGVLTPESRADLDARGFWRWTAVARVVTDRAQIMPEYLMRSEFLDGLDRLQSARSTKRRDLLRKVRYAIRWLRQERRRHGGLPRPSRLLAAIGVPALRAEVLDFRFALPGEWLAAPLDTPDALREEGATMQHCLGRCYVEDVIAGDAKAYTLRSKDGVERVTLLIELWPVHIGAMGAAFALIRMVAPNATHVEI